jgi:predicted negative regulator of RcsB-dependent stress response
MGRLKNLKKWLKENGEIIIAYVPVIGLMTIIVLLLLKIRIF